MSFFVLYFNEWKVKAERSWLMYGNVDKESLRKKKMKMTDLLWMWICFREDNVADLLTNMLDTGKNESVIVNGLSVIQTLLEFRKQG